MIRRALAAFEGDGCKGKKKRDKSGKIGGGDNVRDKEKNANDRDRRKVGGKKRRKKDLRGVESALQNTL